MKTAKAFTLLEMIVVIAILSVMTGATIIGIRSFSNNVQLKNASGRIKNLIKEARMEIVSGEYKENLIHFKKHYLIIESKDENNTLLLKFGTCNNDDNNDDYINIINQSSEIASLMLGNTQGELFDDPKNIESNGEYCVKPLQYKKENLVYWLQNKNKRSKLLRIFRLNPLVDKTEISIEDTNLVCNITSPYGKKTCTPAGNNITLKTIDNETLNLKP